MKIMLDMPLQDFVRQIDKICCDRFANEGELSPIYFALDNDNNVGVIPVPPLSKDQTVALMRKLFVDLKIQRYVFVCEAWSAFGEGDNKKLEEFAENNSLEHWEGRNEIIMYAAEDLQEGMQMGHRIIRRAEGAPPQLSDLEFSPIGSLSGRMVGLLPSGKANA